MNKPSRRRLLTTGAVMSAALLALTARATLQDHDGDRDHDSDHRRGHHPAVQLATGQFITPTAIDDAVQQYLNPGLPGYPNFVAGEAVRSQLSPDGSTLAVITAGQNSLVKSDGTIVGTAIDGDNSTQYIFIYDVQGAHRARPALKQVIKQVNAHVGLVFSPDGHTLYAAGGADDKVYVYAKSGGAWTAAAQIPLGHADQGIGVNVRPNVSGLGLSADGRTLVAANNYNDSISVIDTATRTVRYEHDLRPYFPNNEGRNGGVGGTFPYAVVMKGNGTAYVSSDRDREVVVVDVSSPTSGRLIKRVRVDGNALGMTLDHSQTRLYVAQDNADQVAVIDTVSNRVIDEIDARAPEKVLKGQKYTGAGTSAVTLSPDGSTLYAVNSGANSIAVIPLDGRKASSVDGLIPTAYEPHDVTFSADGSWMYIVNGKSVTGPNPKWLSGDTVSIDPPNNIPAAIAAFASNQYQFQLERASLVSAPVPHHGHLEELTNQVARNNFYKGDGDGDDKHVMDFLRRHIKHVIYVVKENRTFDQILGDLTNGADADPNLTQFGRLITPNHHNLATRFVTLDNFMNPGDGSMDGWSWAMQGRVTNTEALTQQINYAFIDRGLSYESEGENRNSPVNWSAIAQRDAAEGPAGTTNYSTATAGLPGGTANVLTGVGNHASTDAPFGIQAGFIFNAVLRAGRTVRNYGFLVNNVGRISIGGAPVSDPFAVGEKQVAPLDQVLAPLTDLYFRGYDQAYPDLWRYNEWKREFDQFVANGNLPSLSLLRISHDHMGSFGTALGGVNTPEAQQADCDLALGRIVEAVANSRYAADTLIMVIEDDVQDGPDHVDSHRGTAYVVGPYVKQEAVISTRYNQVSVLRTIEDILGTEHLNLNTAFQDPMTDLFDIHGSARWSFVSEVPGVLAGTSMALAQSGEPVRFAAGSMIKPKHDATYWASVTAGFDFSQADHVPPALFNRVLWDGLMGGRPYPVERGWLMSARSAQ